MSAEASTAALVSAFSRTRRSTLTFLLYIYTYVLGVSLREQPGKVGSGIVCSLSNYAAGTFFPSPRRFSIITSCRSARGSIIGDEDGRLYERMMGLPILRAARGRSSDASQRGGTKQNDVTLLAPQNAPILWASPPPASEPISDVRLCVYLAKQACVRQACGTQLSVQHQNITHRCCR